MDKDGMVYVAQAQRYLLEVRRLEKKVNRPITEHPDVQRLIGQVVELQAENAKLKNDIRIMVEKAADNHLEGYRELGTKLAAMESTNEELQAENAKLKEIIKRFLVIAEALKGGCWE